MSSSNAPFGMRPAFHPSGLDRAQALANGIVSGYTVDILKGAPVKMDTTGVIQAAAAGDAFLGAFAGVEWTDTTGRRRVSNYWPANTAYQAGSCIAYYYQEQTIVYEVQSTATLAQTSIGDQCNMSSATAGSTTTGLSAAMLGTVVGASSQGDFRIIDLAPYADNAWGDPFVIVRVQISRHQYTANIVAI